MAHIALEELNSIFQNTEDASSDIRLIIPQYRVGEAESETNTYIVDKTVQHFRNHGRANGVYRLGHGLELVLGEKSNIQEDPPF
jgi:hypothetical protein